MLNWNNKWEILIYCIGWGFRWYVWASRIGKCEVCTVSVDQGNLLSQQKPNYHLVLHIVVKRRISVSQEMFAFLYTVTTTVDIINWGSQISAIVMLIFRFHKISPANLFKIVFSFLYSKKSHDGVNILKYLC